jgi:hypothetical protein
MSLPTPTPAVAVALASLAVHAQEALGPNGHAFDLTAMEGCLNAPGVREYLDQLGELGLLPVTR